MSMPLGSTPEIGETIAALLYEMISNSELGR